MRKSFLSNAACVAVLLVFLFSACRTSRKITQPGQEPVLLKSEPADSVFQKVLEHEHVFRWLSAKADVEYSENADNKISFSVNMRMCSDSVIWLSVAPLLGIEAVRAMITPDSIYILDRLHHRLIARGYQYLEDLLKIKVTFGMLQAILTGKYFSGIEGEKIQSVYDESPYYILSTLPRLKTLRALEEKNPEHLMVQDFWVDTAYRIARTRIEDHSTARSLAVEYNDFMAVNTGFFPRFVRLLAESGKSSEIRIQYAKVSFEGPLGFPFSVPEKYTRE